MRTLLQIESDYHATANRLNAPSASIKFATTPQHDGSPHIESNGTEYAYVVTERGEELERRAATTDDDILYWLVSDLTWSMATQFELSNRNSSMDSRRLIFQKHLELLGNVNRDWQARKQLEYDSVLKHYPFHDDPA